MLLLEQLLEPNRRKQRPRSEIKKQPESKFRLNSSSWVSRELSQTSESDRKGNFISYTFSFGTNHRRLPKIRTVLEMIEECLSDTILRILIAAATTAMIVGTYQNPDHGWIEGLSIYFAIVIIISVTTTNDYIKEKQFQKLVDKANDTTCFVTRNQETKEISAEDLLVGDLVKIVPGMSVPADCIL